MDRYNENDKQGLAGIGCSQTDNDKANPTCALLHGEDALPAITSLSVNSITNGQRTNNYATG